MTLFVLKLLSRRRWNSTTAKGHAEPELNASPVPQSHAAGNAGETVSEYSSIVNEDVPDTAAIEESDIDDLDDADVLATDDDDGPSELHDCTWWNEEGRR